MLCAACPHRCPHENVSSQATLGELTLTALDGAGIAPSVDVVMAWLIERLGSRAVNRTANLVAFVCELATLAFIVVVVVAVSR